MFRKLIIIISEITALLILCACPAPISREILNNVTDDLSPVVEILSPSDGSYCARSVIISGAVSDLSSETEAPGQIKYLYYEVLSSTTGGEITADDDGTFSFEFSTANFGSNFVVRVTAEDWNGNVGEDSLNLQKIDGNDIPSFAVVSGAAGVSLSWDDVPGTSSYTLYYTTDGSTPSAGYGESVTGIVSPYDLSSLENGSMHVFQLRAHSSAADGDDSWSGYLQSIPLAPETLVPSVIPGTGQLLVKWPEIPATNTFEIWRSRSESGSYIQIANNLTGNEFTDRQVPAAGGYFYKIRPTQEGSPHSAPGYGSASVFPASPEIVRTIDTIGNTYATTVAGDYLFVAEGAAGLRIMDISDPASPAAVKTVGLGSETGQYAFNVVVADGYAYVANGYEGLQIVDIDPIASASVVKQVSKGAALESARDVAIDSVNGFAYVADNYTGLFIIDISDIPTADYYKEVPVTNAEAVVLSGGYAYVAGSAGVSVVDLDNPAAPSAAYVNNTIAAVNSNDVDVADNMLHIATGSTTDDYEIWDISTPTAPVELETLDLPLTLDYAVGVTVSGGYAYVAAENSGLQIINIGVNRSGTLYPAVVKTSVNTGNAQGSSVKGEYLYLADSGSGVRVINISEPSRAATLLEDPSPGLLWGIEVRGDYAYLAESATGMVIMDISNPLSPSVVKTVATPGEARDITLLGRYAFIADWDEGIQIIDISDHAAAQIVHSLATADWTDTVKISGNYLYAAANTAGVQIFDISDPESAFLVATVDTDDQVKDLAVAGNYLFAADDTAGVKVIDIEVPSAARVVHNLFNGAAPMHDGTALSVSVRDRYLYVGVSLVSTDLSPVIDNSILVYDVSDPEGTDAVEYGYPLLNLTGVYDIHLSGAYACLSTANYGLQIVDISDLTKAGFVKRVTTSGSIYDCYVVDDYAFCAAGIAGLQIIDLKPW